MGCRIRVGGGGTTVCEDAPALPLSSRRRSRAESADGGGATTEGAGRFSFALRPLSRSGAETGGGTTAVVHLHSRGRDFAAAGGGSGQNYAGVKRRSGTRLVAGDARRGGAITLEFRDGAASVRWRETLGAGAMMLESRAGARSAVFGSDAGRRRRRWRNSTTAWFVRRRERGQLAQGQPR